MSTTSTERAGAYAAGGESPQRSKFPWWLLLLALAVIAVVAFLLTRGADDAGDGTTTSEQQSGQTADGTGGGAAGDAAGENAGKAPGKISAGGATVYPLSEGLTVGDYAGQKVVGTAVPVESVVDDAGFWVGSNADDRIFVLLTGTGADSPPVEPGDAIDFEGVVAKHGKGFAEQIGVQRNAGAKRLTALKGHVEIAEYRLAE